MSAGIAGSRVMGLAAVGMLALSVACKGSDSAQAAPGTPPVMVSPENLYVVATSRLETGPAISGSLTPEQQATIRAEVGGSVVSTSVEEGQRVSKGMRLAKIDDTGIQDSFLSARSGMTAAQNAAETTKREEERATALLQAGAIAERDVEGAKRANIAAQAQLADARARLAIAEKQLANTIVTAPFDGVVSKRNVSAGDNVQPGGEMFTIVDPTSMRLEASVPAEEITSVRIGMPVNFTVAGYTDRVFVGRVTRMSPTADPVTRQVHIFASIPNVGAALVGGLFAEGRVTAETRVVPTAPMEAIDQKATVPAVMRVRNGTVERVAVTLGIHDAATDRVEIVSGVATGDTLLVGPARSISPNTPVRVPLPAERAG